MKTKAIKCVIALIIIAACVIAGISIANYGNYAMAKEYNLNVAITYVTMIGSALFLMI